MKIKRSLLKITDSTITWDVLTETYLPEYDRGKGQVPDGVLMVFFLLADMHAQTRKGGLMEFLDCDSGNRFHETLQAANAVECYSLIQLMESIADLFPGGIVPCEKLSRRHVLDSFMNTGLPGKNKEGMLANEWKALWDNWEKDYDALQGSLFSRTRDYLAINADLEDE